jgi:predicted alpha/beta superfamily hydrolase
MQKLILIIALFMAACSHPEQKTETVPLKEEKAVKLFSSQIKDTFYISVQAPKDLIRGEKLPAIYLLDGNFYYDIMAPTFKTYGEVGLLPRAILVGIGYKDFGVMDSLRGRDLTYPLGAGEFEMPNSGGGENFLHFIESELIPYIESHYACDTGKRVLMGHSLGGYFTLYALQQQLAQKKNTFSSFIAASPSADYNHNYILKEFEKLRPAEQQRNVKVYASYGGLEDNEESNFPEALKCPAMLNELSRLLKDKQKLPYRGDMYSEFGHMDMGFPTFVKGIQFAFGIEP